MHTSFRSIVKFASLSLTTAALLAMPLRAETATASAGAFDFGTFAPPNKGGEFVEVNLHGALLKLASRIVEKEEPEVSKLLANLHAVRVNVVGMDDDNREALAKRVAAIRDDLTARGWHKIVTAQQKDQDVGVYMQIGDDEVIQGIVVTVIDGKSEAVFVNVVGSVSPDQIVTLAQHFGLEPLKHIKVAGA